MAYYRQMQESADAAWLNKKVSAIPGAIDLGEIEGDVTDRLVLLRVGS